MSAQSSSTAARRLPNGMVPNMILDAAEVLFSESGFDAVSFREIARAAGVSLSAINYHFGSKEGLLREVFARRAADLVERRAEQLSALPRQENGALPLVGIIDAFVRPALEVARGDRNDLFNRMLARLAVGSGEGMREIISRAFDESDHTFIEEFARALPALSRAELHWRFHFLVGGMIYTMSDAGQLEGLSGGLCSARDNETTLRELTTSYVALFNTPDTESSG